MNDYEGTYAIRIHRLARRDIDEAINRMAIFTDEKYATEWHDGLLGKLAALAALPKRGPIAEENRLFRIEVRVIPYRFGPGSAIYRVLYSINEPDEDAPFVHVLHVRHAARKPMTRAEAQKIEEDNA